VAWRCADVWPCKDASHGDDRRRTHRLVMREVREEVACWPRTGRGSPMPRLKADPANQPPSPSPWPCLAQAWWQVFWEPCSVACEPTLRPAATGTRKWFGGSWHGPSIHTASGDVPMTSRPRSPPWQTAGTPCKKILPSHALGSQPRVGPSARSLRAASATSTPSWARHVPPPGVNRPSPRVRACSSATSAHAILTRSSPRYSVLSHTVSGSAASCGVDGSCANSVSPPPQLLQRRNNDNQNPHSHAPARRRSRPVSARQRGGNRTEEQGPA
jgi:hypothetical protein